MRVEPRIFALVVAAGVSKRAGEGVPKQYRALGGKPMLRYGLEALIDHSAIAGVAAVIGKDHRAYYDEATQGLKLLPPVIGGRERADSVKAGLDALASHTPDYVLIHDAARPFLAPVVIDRVVKALRPKEGVVPALPVADTVRRLHKKKWEEVEREHLYRIQTPQGFPFAPLLALQSEDVARFTDDAALWLAAKLPLGYVEGDERLRKVTTAEDMLWAASYAGGAARTTVGFGYDVHRLVAGSGLTLAGINVPHDKKLDGHSDADVALHALVDAILGALGEGDIGQHFPPTDPQWKGADSSIFVAEAVHRVAARGGTIEHADMTIICEAPRIAPHREAMRNAVATLLKVEERRVSVKATTTEGIGFTGKREGIAAQAVVTLSLPR